MKKQVIKTAMWLVAAATINMSSITEAQSVGISATGTPPDNSALLDVDASGLPANNKKGLLIPRVSLTSNTDVTTIPSPANSLVVYNTNASMTNGNGAGFYYWDAGAGKWIYMASPANGPGNTGQVLTSQGAGNPPQVRQRRDIARRSRRQADKGGRVVNMCAAFLTPNAIRGYYS